MTPVPVIFPVLISMVAYTNYLTLLLEGYNVALLVVYVGVVFLLGDIHFPFIFCAVLTWAYWFASAWLIFVNGSSLGLFSVVVGIELRSSWLLFGGKKFGKIASGSREK